jgi:hypothetical protein
VVDLDAALGKELLDVAIGQAEAQVPADRQDDHLGWEPETGEGGPWDRGRAGAASSHAESLAAEGGHGERNTAGELDPGRMRAGSRSGSRHRPFSVRRDVASALVVHNPADPSGATAH